MAEISADRIEIVMMAFIDWLKARIDRDWELEEWAEVAAQMVHFTHFDEAEGMILAVDPEGGEVLARMDSPTYQALLKTGKPKDNPQGEPRDE